MKQKKLKLAIISAVLSLSVFVGVTPLSTNFGVANNVFGVVSVKAADAAITDAQRKVDEATSFLSTAKLPATNDKIVALKKDDGSGAIKDVVDAIATAKAANPPETTIAEAKMTALVNALTAAKEADALWRQAISARSEYVKAKVAFEAALETNAANFHKVDYQDALAKHIELYTAGDAIYGEPDATTGLLPELTAGQISQLNAITQEIKDVTDWYNKRPVATINTAEIDKKVADLEKVIEDAKAVIADPAYVNNNSTSLRATVVAAEAEIARINAVKATINTDNKHKSQAEIDELFAEVDSSAVAKAVTDEINKFTNGATLISNAVKALEDAIARGNQAVTDFKGDKKGAEFLALEKAIKDAKEDLATLKALPATATLKEKQDAVKAATVPEDVKAIDDAIKNLPGVVDPVAVDKAALEAGIKEATDYVKGTEIAEANKAALQAAIDAANVVFNNKKATQAEVDAAKVTLKAALDAAKKPVVDPVKVDKSALETAVKEAEALIAEGKLNPEVKKALQEIVDAAKVVLVNKDATQNEINNATSNLKAAISVAKASITGTTNINVVIVIINNYCANICKPLPVDPCKPVDPVKPVGPVDPCKPAVKPADPCTTVTPAVTPAVKPSVTVPAVTPTTVTTKLPQTGGIDPSAIFGLSALMSLAGITLGKKNRK